MSIRLLCAVVLLVLAGVGLSLGWYLEAEAATWRAQRPAAAPSSLEPVARVRTDGVPAADTGAAVGARSCGAPESVAEGLGDLPPGADGSAKRGGAVGVSAPLSAAEPVRPCSLPRIDLDFGILDAAPAAHP